MCFQSVSRTQCVEYKQSRPSPKTRKATITVSWTRTDITSCLKTHSVRYGLKRNTKQQKKAAVLKENFEPFERLSVDDIVRCLQLMRDRQTEEDFVASFNVHLVDSKQQHDETMAAKLTALTARCAVLEASNKEHVKRLELAQQTIAKQKATISRLQSVMASQQSESLQQLAITDVCHVSLAVEWRLQLFYWVFVV